MDQLSPAQKLNPRRLALRMDLNGISDAWRDQKLLENLTPVVKKTPKQHIRPFCEKPKRLFLGCIGPSDQLSLPGKLNFRRLAFRMDLKVTSDAWRGRKLLHNSTSVVKNTPKQPILAFLVKGAIIIIFVVCRPHRSTISSSRTEPPSLRSQNGPKSKL